EPILGPSKKRAARRQRADDPAGFAKDVQLRAYRIVVGEEIGSDVGPNKADRIVPALLGFAVEAAGVDLDPLDLEHTRRQAANLHTAGHCAAPSRTEEQHSDIQIHT